MDAAAKWSNQLSELALADLIASHVLKAGGVRRLAKKWKVSPAYVSDLQHGRRMPGPRVQKLIGVQITRTTRTDILYVSPWNIGGAPNV